MVGNCLTEAMVTIGARRREIYVYNQHCKTIGVSRRPVFSLQTWRGSGRRRQVNQRSVSKEKAGSCSV